MRPFTTASPPALASGARGGEGRRRGHRKGLLYFRAMIGARASVAGDYILLCGRHGNEYIEKFSCVDGR